MNPTYDGDDVSQTTLDTITEASLPSSSDEMASESSESDMEQQHDGDVKMVGVFEMVSNDVCAYEFHVTLLIRQTAELLSNRMLKIHEI